MHICLDIWLMRVGSFTCNNESLSLRQFDSDSISAPLIRAKAFKRRTSAGILVTNQLVFDASRSVSTIVTVKWSSSKPCGSDHMLLIEYFRFNFNLMLCWFHSALPHPSATFVRLKFTISLRDKKTRRSQSGRLMHAPSNHTLRYILASFQRSSYIS